MGSLQSGPPSSLSHPSCPTLASEDVAPGRILWLPTRDECLMALDLLGVPTSEPVSTQAGLNDDLTERFYNHPIVVISRPGKYPYRMHFLLLTSLGGRSVAQAVGSAALQRKYLAIGPTPRHPLHHMGNELYRTLKLKAGNKAMKRGYVYAARVYTMDWRAARQYLGSRKVLSAQVELDDVSMGRMLHAVGLMTPYRLGSQYSGYITSAWSTSSSRAIEDAPTIVEAPHLIRRAGGKLFTRLCSFLLRTILVVIVLAVVVIVLGLLFSIVSRGDPIG